MGIRAGIDLCHLMFTHVMVTISEGSVFGLHMDAYFHTSVCSHMHLMSEYVNTYINVKVHTHLYLNLKVIIKAPSFTHICMYKYALGNT